MIKIINALVTYSLILALDAIDTKSIQKFNQLA